VADGDTSLPELEIGIMRQPDMSNSPKLDLLLLCDYEAGTAGTIVDHIFGIKEFSRHTVHVLSSRGEFPNGLDLKRFDGLIIHYSLVACWDAFIGPRARAAIRQFKGLKIVFVQDDYRFINQTVDAIRDLGTHILFGLAPEDIIDDVYSPDRLPNVVRETVLTGYVPEHLTKISVPRFAERKIDIGYRARKLPAWIGSLGQQKWLIADHFLKWAPQHNLKCDISTSEYDRIYGRDWIYFIANSKSMIGSESGSSVCDFTGDIQKKVEEHERAFPDTPFEVLRDLYFKDEDGRFPMNVISPRCFEAAALRTLMILYEGKYSSRLVPWRHYVPLRLDHSNLDEVLQVLRDPERAQAIVDTAFKEVALNPDNMFPSMVRQMDAAIGRTFRESMRATKPHYTSAAFEIIRRRVRLKAVVQRVLRRKLAQAAAMATAAIEALPRAQRTWVEPKYHSIRHAINTHVVKGRF
jgi:hypothetical protein